MHGHASIGPASLVVTRAHMSATLVPVVSLPWSWDPVGGGLSAVCSPDELQAASSEANTASQRRIVRIVTFLRSGIHLANAFDKIVQCGGEPVKRPR